MSWIDWLITLVPLALVMYFGWYIRRYIKGVSDFLVAGRICHRYVLTTATMANALGLVTLVSFVEVSYKTGFALSFWNTLTLPLGILISMSGYCLYRFRETRAMSLGQFLEIRYNRSLRIFACFLRSIAEMMANIIMPAIAARFFIYYLGLPEHFDLLGWECPTFLAVVLVTLFLAISLICMAGLLSVTVTDTLQGIIFFPSILILMVFVMWKFSWSDEIVQVMSDRVAGESFLNPFDISNLRDFNFFMLLVIFANMLLHTSSGLTGNGGAAASAHEAKMASILGTWRGAFTGIFYTLVAIAIITFMHHSHFAEDAKEIRTDISVRVAEELVPDPSLRRDFVADIKAIPANVHVKGVDRPFSQSDNPDEVYFRTAQENFGMDGEGSSRTQQFKTIFRQLLLPATMRHMLPQGLVGLFCMLILLFIISTDDSRIFSASSTLVQDCIVPFYKRSTLSPQKHIFYIRLVSIGVGVFFLLGSYFMSQLDYINLFIQTMYGMWLGGCGPMIVFGFYSRFGTSAGAWSSLLSGMCVNFCGIVLQRNWADLIYPFLENAGWVDSVGVFLSAVSRPFNPYIVWEMNRLKFPINSYEIYFMAIVISLVTYCVVSWLTCREPFNLERMLHRGVYSQEGTSPQPRGVWSFRVFFSRLLGITSEYSRRDRIIAWSVFVYSIVYKFVLMFVAVAVWNVFWPWSLESWSTYFLVTFLVVPGIAAVVTTLWFGIGGVRDLYRMFHDLEHREVNPLDNGMVEEHMSLVDHCKDEAGNSE